MQTRSQGYPLLLFLLLSLVLLALVMAALASSARAASGDVTAGKAIYTRLCLGCHGADGRGGRMGGMLRVTPRNLADPTYMHTRSSSQLFRVIKHGGTAAGLSSAMPAFGGQLSDEEIRHTLAYVGTFSAGATIAAGSTPSEEGVRPPASAALHLTQLRLSIWPEYDDPRVLVMFRGVMAPSEALPTQLYLPIPKGAEVIGAGMISAQDEMLLHPHRVIPGDTSDRLEINLPAPHFFAEFYYDPWTQAGDEKHFTFTFASPYPLAQLEVDIQQPHAATNFVTEPETLRQDVDAQGNRFYRYTYRDLAPGDTKTFSVSYVKTTPQPSVSKRQPAPSPNTVSSQPTNTRNAALGLLAGVVVLYAGGAFLWTGYRRRRQAVAPATPLSGPAPGEPTASLSGSNFCSNCGQKLQPAFVFCPGCGQPTQGVKP